MVVFGIVVVVVGGIIVVVVTITTATGRRANKKINLFILWPTIPQRNIYIYIIFFMAGKIYSVLRFTIFVNELVTVNSQFISSFVIEFPVVKFSIIFIIVVVIPFFTRKTSN